MASSGFQIDPMRSVYLDEIEKWYVQYRIESRQSFMYYTDGQIEKLYGLLKEWIVQGRELTQLVVSEFSKSVQA